MENSKHYPTHPGAEHPPTMTCEIPLEEYESIKRENEQLKADNKRLVKCCKEYDSRQRIDERIKFNGAQQLRATKRALWLARAERAKEMCQRLLIQGFDPKWQEVERKCLAKAKEYK